MNQQQQPQGLEANDAIGFLHIAAASWAAAVTPFLRTRLGAAYPGWAGLFATLIMFSYAAFAPAPGMVAYFWFWLFFLLCQKARSRRLERKGQIEHSMYAGWPWLAMLVPFVRTERVAKGLIEPLICLLAGTLLCLLDPGVGGFVFLSAFALTTTRALESAAAHMRARRMRDAFLEQQAAARQFRGGDDY